MSNAVDFISAYNRIDAALRSIFKGKGNLQFSDLVRRCADINRIVGKYEEELLSYARLRNAIVHNSTREHIIAEPSNEATEELKLIARLLSDPPRLGVLKEKKLIGISAEDSLASAIKLMSEKGISNLPVYRGERFIGLINNRRIVRMIGKNIVKSVDIDKFLHDTACEQVVHEEDMRLYYKVLTEKNTVQEAIDSFSENMKLLAVVVMDGQRAGICNLLTVGDLPYLMKIVDGV